MDSSNMSLSDIAAVTRNNTDGFGSGNGAWWIIILFLFVFMGGGGLWGNRNTNSPHIRADESGHREKMQESSNNFQPNVVHFFAPS